MSKEMKDSFENIDNATLENNGRNADHKNNNEFNEINLCDEYSVILSEYKKYTQFPPIGYYNTKVRPLGANLFIINLLDFSSVILSVVETDTMQVYIQSVFGTHEYEFSKKHLDSSHMVLDALRLGYNSFICDLIPSQQYLDYENGVPLDKIFSKTQPEVAKGFWNRTVKSLYKSLQENTSERSRSVSTDLNTAVSFLDLETEYNKVLENLSTKKENFSFKAVQSKFNVIFEKDYYDVEGSITENCYAVDVVVDKDLDDALEIIEESKNGDLIPSLLGTPLENQDFNFLSTKKKPLIVVNSLNLKQSPSFKKLKSCFTEFFQTQNNYHLILESFYDNVVRKCESIADLKVKKVFENFQEVLKSERVIFYFFMRILGFNDSVLKWRGMRNMEKDECYYRNILTHGFSRTSKNKEMDSSNNTLPNDVSLDVSQKNSFIYNSSSSIGQAGDETNSSHTPDGKAKNDQRTVVEHLIDDSFYEFIGGNLNDAIVEVVEKLETIGKVSDRVEKIFAFFNQYVELMDKYKGFFTLYSMHDITPILESKKVSLSEFEGGLEGVFILPVQRMVRYKQFLEKFYKYVDARFISEQFTDALTKLSNFIFELDRERFCFESGRKAFIIQKKVENCPPDILNVKRAFKRQLNGEIARVVRLSFFLYNDILMVAARSSDETDIFKESDLRLRFIKYIPLQNVRIIQIAKNTLKFIFTEEVTEKNLANVPGSRVINTGDDITETFVVSVKDRGVNDFLKEFFFFRNNDYSMKKQSKMFFDMIENTFVFYHVIEYDKYQRVGSSVVINLSNREVSKGKERKTVGKVNTEIGKFLISKEKLIWTIRKGKVKTNAVHECAKRDSSGNVLPRNHGNRSPDEVLIEQNVIECVVYSSKRIKIQPLIMTSSEFKAKFKSLFLKSMLINSQFFPWEKKRMLRCAAISWSMSNRRITVCAYQAITNLLIPIWQCSTL
ncbi:FYVE finger containing protein [Trachipleistophora hominis]|uniref:FYVE finger containing protein n=1 Tax=Trachipleistophora hominis TaxID=72359 RepID=L7JXX2_TRAHO|nr:FYVE finger containing protein [Trachipleistophora hominis]